MSDVPRGAVICNVPNVLSRNPLSSERISDISAAAGLKCKKMPLPASVRAIRRVVRWNSRQSFGVVIPAFDVLIECA
jgi:hypothetical protein